MRDQGVSPTVGVILMVAITIILVAVITAFVFSVVGTTTENKTVNVTVSSIEITTDGYYRVGFASGDIIVFGRDAYLSEDIKPVFARIIVPGEYRMTYTRVNYNRWTLVDVRPPDK